MRRAIFATAALGLSLHAHAGELPALQFLSMQQSARSVGMGGVETTLLDDPGAAFSNPAGLARAEATRVYGGISSFGAESPPLTFFSVTRRIYRLKSTLGISGSYYKIVSEGYDVSGNRTQDSSDKNMSFGVTCARAFGKSWSFGLTGRYARETLNPEETNGLPSTSADALMVSFGVIYAPTDAKWRGAAVLYHWGTNVQFDGSSQKYPLPSGIKVGFAYFPHGGQDLMLAVDLDEPKSKSATSLSLGAHYLMTDWLTTRLGTAVRKRSTTETSIIPTLGISLGVSHLVLDISTELDMGGVGNNVAMAASWEFDLVPSFLRSHE